MEEFDVIIIDAGIVGLAIAHRLSQKYENVLLIEKEESFGRHTSSRNSEVIHSGIYYQTGSLKAKLCVRGNELLYDFLQKYELPYRNCGKLVIATDDQELPILDELYKKGINNGVSGLKILSEEESKKLEPLFKSVGSLYVPSTGIMDTHRAMSQLEFLAEQNGALIAYNTEAVGIERRDNEYIVQVKDEDIRIKAPVLINSAGLWSDKVAEMAGIPIEECGYKIHFCKGEYYKTTRYKYIRHLVYPVPDPSGLYLGIHTRINLNGELSFGPNAYYVDELDYRIDDRYHEEFYQAIKKYLDIEYDDISPDDCGIRPKLQGENEPERDFVISNEKEKGFPNLINIIGIESPGLTCSLAIAEYVEKIISS
jgi:L-2-hydroxyglutarate oxidase LhgO